MPTSTFQELGTVTFVPVASLPGERRCQSTWPRVCVGKVPVGHVRTCNELESAVSSFFALSSAWSFSTMWKKDMAPVFSCFVRSLELKCEACNSKTRYLQAQPATLGIPVHVQKTSSAKRFLLSAGEVDRFCHWHRRRGETAISAGQDRIGQKMKKTDMSVSKLKQQVARIENDARYVAADSLWIAFRRSSSAAHPYVRSPGLRLKWVNSQDLLPFAWFLLVDLSLSRDCDRRRNWPQTERRQNVSDAKSKKVSGRRFKTRSVGLVEAETFFCLA